MPLTPRLVRRKAHDKKAAKTVVRAMMIVRLDPSTDVKPGKG